MKFLNIVGCWWITPYLICSTPQQLQHTGSPTDLTAKNLTEQQYNKEIHEKKIKKRHILYVGRMTKRGFLNE